jgi:hypothetical protein
MSPDDPRRPRIRCSAKSFRQTRKSCAHKELQFHGVKDGSDVLSNPDLPPSRQSAQGTGGTCLPFHAGGSKAKNSRPKAGILAPGEARANRQGREGVQNNEGRALGGTVGTQAVGYACSQGRMVHGTHPSTTTLRRFPVTFDRVFEIDAKGV